jgi:lipoprotein-anchoring transpeptidase ErfK/SrfK
VRLKKIAVGLAAMVAVAAVAACSSTSAASQPHISTAADTSNVSTSTTASTPDPTTSKSKPVTPPATKTATKTAPKTTPKAPATTNQHTVTQAVTKIAGVPCSATAKACVDLSARKAWLIEDGKVVLGPVSIMPGRVGHLTPTGTFHVQSHVANYYSRKYKAPMPEATFFAPGIAFHVGSLSVHSHGCVHMSRSSATKFFNTLKVGDEVQIVR